MSDNSVYIRFWRAIKSARVAVWSYTIRNRFFVLWIKVYGYYHVVPSSRLIYIYILVHRYLLTGILDSVQYEGAIGLTILSFLFLLLYTYIVYADYDPSIYIYFNISHLNGYKRYKRRAPKVSSSLYNINNWTFYTYKKISIVIFYIGHFFFVPVGKLWDCCNNDRHCSCCFSVKYTNPKRNSKHHF